MNTFIAGLGILLVLAIIGMGIAMLIAALVAGVAISTFVFRHRSQTRVGP